MQFKSNGRAAALQSSGGAGIRVQSATYGMRLTNISTNYQNPDRHGRRCGHPPKSTEADRRTGKYVCKVNGNALLTAINLVKFKSELAEFEAIDEGDKHSARKIESLQSLVFIFESACLWLNAEHDHGRLQSKLALEWVTPPPERPRSLSTKQFAFEGLLGTGDCEELYLSFDDNPRHLSCALGASSFTLAAAAITAPHPIADPPADLQPKLRLHARALSSTLARASIYSSRNNTDQAMESVSVAGDFARGGRTSASTSTESVGLAAAPMHLHYKTAEFMRSVLRRVEHSYRLGVEEDLVRLWSGNFRAEFPMSIPFPEMKEMLAYHQNEALVAHVYAGQLATVPSFAAMVRPETQTALSSVPTQVWRVGFGGAAVLLFRGATSRGRFTIPVPAYFDQSSPDPRPLSECADAKVELGALGAAHDLSDLLAPPLVTIAASLVRKAIDGCAPTDLVELRLRRSAMTLRITRDGMSVTHVLAGKN